MILHAVVLAPLMWMLFVACQLADRVHLAPELIGVVRPTAFACWVILLLVVSAMTQAALKPGYGWAVAVALGWAVILLGAIPIDYIMRVHGSVDGHKVWHNHTTLVVSVSVYWVPTSLLIGSMIASVLRSRSPRASSGTNPANPTP